MQCTGQCSTDQGVVAIVQAVQVRAPAVQVRAPVVQAKAPAVQAQAMPMLMSSWVKMRWLQLGQSCNKRGWM